MADPQPAQVRRRRLLNTPLTLHDVADVERLAGRVLEERLREWRATLPAARGEDALAFLVSTAWELSRDHDPTLQAFSTRCYRTLRLRLVDWFRAEFGDSRYAPRPALLSLDRVLDDADADELGADASSRLGSWSSALVDAGENVEEAAFHSAAFGLEWSDLSREAFEAISEIGRPLADGTSLEAIARELEQPLGQIKRRIEALKAELLEKRPDLPEWLAA